jgi:hypothetical protein
MSFKYSRTGSLGGTSSLLLPDPVWFSYPVFGRLPSDLEDLDALLTKVLLHVHEEGLDLSGPRSSAESPWRRSVDVTKPRSRPCAAMASMASSRRVVSFPLLHPCFEANIRAASPLLLTDSCR